MYKRQAQLTIICQNRDASSSLIVVGRYDSEELLFMFWQKFILDASWQFVLRHISLSVNVFDQIGSSCSLQPPLLPLSFRPYIYILLVISKNQKPIPRLVILKVYDEHLFETNVILKHPSDSDEPAKCIDSWRPVSYTHLQILTPLTLYTIVDC